MSTLEVREVHEPPELATVGRAYDGNNTGCPTLHGLGAASGRAHADHEHVIITEMIPRTRLLTALVEEYLR
ncbi:hypothetical protein [Streptomyces huasconensis]|uniref:hypothetical protein n=1 Tax=Streptomyces huasconensis TaxID=1854574 RepID=UPI0036FE86A5